MSVGPFGPTYLQEERIHNAKEEEANWCWQNVTDMRAIINKKAGMEVAHDLPGDNPTAVRTDSHWFAMAYSIICKGSERSPSGQVTEIEPRGSGKSFLAAQVAANAQKMGIDVITSIQSLLSTPRFLSVQL